MSTMEINPGQPGNPNADPSPNPGGPSPERQSPEIPPEIIPPAPPAEPNRPSPGPGPDPSSPNPNPHEPIRVV